MTGDIRYCLMQKVYGDVESRGCYSYGVPGESTGGAILERYDRIFIASLLTVI